MLLCILGFIVISHHHQSYVSIGEKQYIGVPSYLELMAFSSIMRVKTASWRVIWTVSGNKFCHAIPCTRYLLHSLSFFDLSSFFLSTYSLLSDIFFTLHSVFILTAASILMGLMCKTVSQISPLSLYLSPSSRLSYPSNATASILNLLFHLILLFPVISFLSQVQFHFFLLSACALPSSCISLHLFCTSFCISPAPNSSALFTYFQFSQQIFPGLSACSSFFYLKCNSSAPSYHS